MRFALKMLLFFACLALTTPTYAKKGSKDKGAAAKSSGGNKLKTGSRERHIVREAQSSKTDKSKIDFEATDIGGQRRLPLGTNVNQNKNDKNYDLIKIRLRWHPEMVQSTASLESGG